MDAYSWTVAPVSGGTASPLTGNLQTITVTSNSNYTISLVTTKSGVTSDAGCSKDVVINTPGDPTATGATRCGTGSVTLSSTLGTSGTGNHWYATSTSTAVLFTGLNYVTPSLSVNTTYFVASFNATCEGARVSAVATINNISPGVIAGGGALCTPFNPDAFTSTTAGSGDGAITYQWQSRTGTSAFADISGATLATYDPGAVSVATDFRRVATSTLNTVACADNSNVLTVTLNAVPYRPVVTVQEALICAGTNSTPTITVLCSIVGVYHLTQGATTTDVTNLAANEGKDLVIPVAVGLGGFSLTVTNASNCLSGATTCTNNTNTCAAQVYRVSSPSLPVGALVKNIQTEAYPNPTSHDATIKFSVPKSGHVVVSVYDAMGRPVATLFDGEALAGEQRSVVLKGGTLAAGTYTYRVVANGMTKTNRVILDK